jgi:hypothetical protein
MDRDVVNAVHYLYQNGATEMQHVLAPLWCAPDTEDAVKDLTEEFGDKRRLNPYLYKFLKDLEGQLMSLPRGEYVLGFPLSAPQRKRGEGRAAFVAMPYGPNWFKCVCDTIVKSASSAGFVAEVSKDISVSGTVRDQIWIGIRRAEAVLADITDHNPNVLYEVGLAHALGKHTILIAQHQTPLPFDVAADRLIRYSAAERGDLAAKLDAAFRAVPARYPFGPPARMRSPRPVNVRVRRRKRPSQ